MTARLASQLGTILTEARGPRSRRAMAEELELSNTTLISLEQGKANPTLERVEKMAAAYGIELELRAVRRRRPPTPLVVDEHATRPPAPSATA